MVINMQFDQMFQMINFVYSVITSAAVTINKEQNFEEGVGQ